MHRNHRLFGPGYPQRCRHMRRAGHAGALGHPGEIARCGLGKAEALGRLVDARDAPGDRRAQRLYGQADDPGVPAQAIFVGPRQRRGGEHLGALPALFRRAQDAPGRLVLGIAWHLLQRRPGVRGRRRRRRWPWRHQIGRHCRRSRDRRHLGHRGRDHIGGRRDVGPWRRHSGPWRRRDQGRRH